MLSRALSLATVMLLIGCFAADRALAQATNLEAGKNPAQIFEGTCTACHKSPRGLLKTVAPGSLSGFLRQHYTTSSEMAGALSSYLVSNGAADTRAAKPGRDAKTEAKQSGSPEQLDRQGHRLHPGAAPQEAAKPETQPQQAAKPDAEGLSPQGEQGRRGRNAKRLARPGELPEGAKLGRRGQPGSEELPKTDAAKQESGEPAKDDKPKSEPKSEAVKNEGNKPPEGDKPSGETAKTDAPKAVGGETPVLRADPVPAVTPAPKSAEGETHPVQMAAPEAVALPSAASVAPATSAPEPVAPAVAASAPPPPPVAPAGPPAPPISQ
jgi:hypothetical protein